MSYPCVRLQAPAKLFTGVSCTFYAQEGEGVRDNE